MNCYLSANSLVDVIGSLSCYIKESVLRNRADNGFRQFLTLSRFFFDLFKLHRHYSNCRPQNSAPYNRIICQTVEIKHVISFAATTITNPISANLGSKIRFWNRRKEHTLTFKKGYFCRLYGPCANIFRQIVANCNIFSERFHFVWSWLRSSITLRRSLFLQQNISGLKRELKKYTKRQ